MGMTRFISPDQELRMAAQTAEQTDLDHWIPFFLLAPNVECSWCSGLLTEREHKAERGLCKPCDSEGRPA